MAPQERLSKATSPQQGLASSNESFYSNSPNITTVGFYAEETCRRSFTRHLNRSLSRVRSCFRRPNPRQLIRDIFSYPGSFWPLDYCARRDTSSQPGTIWRRRFQHFFWRNIDNNTWHRMVALCSCIACGISSSSFAVGCWNLSRGCRN